VWPVHPLFPPCPFTSSSFALFFTFPFLGHRLGDDLIDLLFEVVSVRTSTNSFSDFHVIWCVGRLVLLRYPKPTPKPRFFAKTVPRRNLGFSAIVDGFWAHLHAKII